MLITTQETVSYTHLLDLSKDKKDEISGYVLQEIRSDSVFMENIRDRWNDGEYSLESVTLYDFSYDPEVDKDPGPDKVYVIEGDELKSYIKNCLLYTSRCV